MRRVRGAGCHPAHRDMIARALKWQTSSLSQESQGAATFRTRSQRRQTAVATASLSPVCPGLSISGLDKDQGHGVSPWKLWERKLEWRKGMSGMSVGKPQHATRLREGYADLPVGFDAR